MAGQDTQRFSLNLKQSIFDVTERDIASAEYDLERYRQRTAVHRKITKTFGIIALASLVLAIVSGSIAAKNVVTSVFSMSLLVFAVASLGAGIFLFLRKLVIKAGERQIKRGKERLAYVNKRTAELEATEEA